MPDQAVRPPTTPKLCHSRADGYHLAGFGGPRRVHSRQLFHALRQGGSVGDSIAAVHGLGLVARQLHGYRPRHARPLQVSHRRPPQVMEDGVRHACPAAGGVPGAAHGADRLAVPVEDMRDVLTRLALQFPRLLQLRLNQLDKRWQNPEGKLSPLPILGRARFKADYSCPEVHLSQVSDRISPLRQPVKALN
jgi:hypothetical protein